MPLNSAYSPLIISCGMGTRSKGNKMPEGIGQPDRQPHTEGCELCVDDDARTAHAAFDLAISEGRLSDNKWLDGGDNPLFAGDYMYMGQKDGRDLFKHRDTRQYLP